MKNIYGNLICAINIVCEECPQKFDPFFPLDSYPIRMNVNTPHGPYPSELLNEVHRLFPALLYDTGRFNNVPDVFDYVRNQMHQNFDLFTNARHEFLQSEGLQTPVRAQQQQRIPPRINRNILAPWTQQQQQQQQQQPQQQQQQQQQTTTTYLRNATPLNNNDEQPSSQDDIDNAISPILVNWLTSILNGASPITTYTTTIPITGLSGQGGNLFEPVPVRPSARALEQGTTITVLETDTEGLCAVCQDSMNTGATVRKINYCSHQFHRTCIDIWFQTHVRCPTCRHDIRDNVHVSTPNSEVSYTNGT